MTRKAFKIYSLNLKKKNAIIFFNSTVLIIYDLFKDIHSKQWYKISLILKIKLNGKTFGRKM